MMMAQEQIVLDIPAGHENNIFGGLDAHLKKIERTLQVEVVLRDGSVRITGESERVGEADRVFGELLKLSERGNTITAERRLCSVAYTGEISGFPGGYRQGARRFYDSGKTD